MLRHDLLVNLPEGMSCRKFRDVGAVPAVEIGKSDNQQFSGGVSFGRPLLGSVEAGGERWTQVEIPSLQSLVGEPGMLAIPTWHALVAVPMGAQARLDRVVPDIGDAIQLNLLPFQEQAADVELLPVVYSVNCESGYFDQESDGIAFPSESFMEFLLLEEDGGMVGGLGDNRNSPTWANTALTRGFYDATWPDLAPEFGEDESIRRLGDILNHGKMYLLTQIGVTQTAGRVSLEAALGELVIWHAFGDPTLEMWTSNPYRMLLQGSAGLNVGEDGLRVTYPHARATITAFQDTAEGTVPVGRAMVQNGVAEIPFFHPPAPGSPIQLSASFENAVSVLLTATQSPQLPDLVIEQIFDPVQPPIDLAPGKDIESLLGVRVGNLGAAVAPGTIDPGGSVKEGYMVDLVLSTDTEVPEGLAVLPGAGAFVEDGLLESGRISRTPDVPASSSVELSTALPINSDLGGVIPVQTPPGPYYLCARVDPADDVEEAIEDNNAICIQVSVTSP